jgi:phosphatidylglycerophosphate synthase
VTPGARTGAKELDYWWTVLFTDPVALPLVRLLARTRWLSPNAVSVVAVGLGLAVGPVFALGTRASLVAGGILFYAAFAVDCVDGKLAREIGATSARGAALDHLGDASRRASASLGLILWLWRSDSAGAGVWVATAYVVVAYLFLELSGPEKGHDRWALLTGRAARRHAGPGLRARASAALARHRLLPNPGMPDIQALVFIVGPVTGLVVPGLAAGLVLVTGACAISARRLLRARPSRGAGGDAEPEGPPAGQGSERSTQRARHSGASKDSAQ